MKNGTKRTNNHSFDARVLAREIHMGRVDLLSVLAGMRSFAREVGNRELEEKLYAASSAAAKTEIRKVR